VFVGEPNLRLGAGLRVFFLLIPEAKYMYC
jgi:hypothetical protein